MGNELIDPYPRTEPKMPLDKESIRIAKKRSAELKKNPPKVTEADVKGAERLFKQHVDFEKSKDRSIENERQGLAKDVASYVHNQVKGVGALFHGIGEGKAKSVKCQLPGCGVHEGEMFNMNDGRWYCREHKLFGNLTLNEQIKELYYA